MREKILVAGKLPSGVESWLKAQPFEVLFENRVGSDGRKGILEKVKEVEGLLLLVTQKADHELIQAAQKLKYISLCSTGYDHVDLESCLRRGIRVSHTPGVLTDATADLTLALILATTRRIVESDRYLRDGRFKGWALDLLLGSELRGKRLGILGLGRIGQAVATRAKAFGMDVVGWSRSATKQSDLLRLSFEETLKTSDLLSIHCAYTNETHHLLNGTTLSQMKKGSFLINTARGPIVDEDALVKALKSGHLSGAGLDVFEEEPKVHPELLKMENVVLLPHIGSATHESRFRMADMSARQLVSMMLGKSENVVFVPGA